MRTHSYCFGCRYSVQMYLRSSSSSSTAGCPRNSVLLATCAPWDKHSSQSRLPVIPDILGGVGVPAVFLLLRARPPRRPADVPMRAQRCGAMITRFSHTRTPSEWRWTVRPSIHTHTRLYRCEDLLWLLFSLILLYSPNPNHNMVNHNLTSYLASKPKSSP